MDSPRRFITITSLFMENFEFKALRRSAHPQVCRKSMLMITFVVIKAACKSEFSDHINSVDQCIQFSVEDTRADCSMPFLDTLVMLQHYGTLSTTVYRKPTHTGLYLQ